MNENIPNEKNTKLHAVEEPKQKSPEEKLDDIVGALKMLMLPSIEVTADNAVKILNDIRGHIAMKAKREQELEARVRECEQLARQAVKILGGAI